VDEFTCRVVLGHHVGRCVFATNWTSLATVVFSQGIGCQSINNWCLNVSSNKDDRSFDERVLWSVEWNCRVVDKLMMEKLYSSCSSATLSWCTCELCS